jgi:D-alanyl-D-alanine carboxypeptidase
MEAMFESEWAEIQENYEYVPTTFNIPAEEVIDDNDVIEGYDNEELDVSADEIDQYSLDDILAANEVSKGTGSTHPTTVSHLSRDDWQLVLVNKQHPVPDDYTFTLGKIKGSMKCDIRIIDDLMDMMQAAKRDGIRLVICSPYRDYNRQTVLFNRKIDSYMEKGYSYMDAYKLASMTVTVPGASEHQIGLALDIVSTSYSALQTGFGETTAGRWLKEHCDEYGFILRYPQGKEYITGIQYEPWHFRYVGKEAAAQIMDREITLEEFLEELD